MPEFRLDRNRPRTPRPASIPRIKCCLGIPTRTLRLRERLFDFPVKLLLDILRVVASKVFAVLAIATVIVAGTFFWMWIREQRGLQDRVATLRIEVETAHRDWQTNRVRALGAEMLLNRLEASRPNPILRPSDYLQWRTEMQAAEAALGAARVARDRAKAFHEETRRSLQTLEDKVDTTFDKLVLVARKTGWTIAIAAAVFLIGPLSWKIFWYYGVAPFAGRSPPMNVLPPDTPGTCRAEASGKVLEVLVEPGTPLLTRMEWLQQYAPSLGKRTRFLLDWRYPFTSYASGLREMTEVRVKPEHAADRVVLTSADDPNAYLVAVRLEEHPGIVLRPGVVVAIRGDIVVRSRWCLGSVHAWISGRLRHVLFAGTGTLYLVGHGGVDLQTAETPVIVEEVLVLGYDGRAAFATARTETFWPYFRNRTSLFDYRFPGGQTFVRQIAAPAEARARSNPFIRTVDSLFNAIGKVLGF